ncbi:MAG: DMT family transporter [Lawsonibacter sp.]|nr:DMT family transporter [Lawsonibacter sp.]
MNKQIQGHVAALFTILNWGTTFIGTKILLRAFTPVEILVFRFLLGASALFVACPHLLRVRDRRQELAFAAAGLSGACLYYLMENVALSYTTAANVGVIVTAAPLFTALIAWKADGAEGRPSTRFFLGFATAMAGICLISFTSLSDVSLDWRGDLLALGAAVMWGVYSTMVKRISAFGYSILQTTRRTFLYGLVFMIPAGLVMDFHWDLFRFENPVYTWIFLYLGLGACALCFVTWGFAVSVLGAVKTSVYIYLSPVITLICAVLILRERITGAALAGAVLTLVGLVISQWDSLKGKKDSGTDAIQEETQAMGLPELKESGDR